MKKITAPILAWARRKGAQIDEFFAKKSEDQLTKYAIVTLVSLVALDLGLLILQIKLNSPGWLVCVQGFFWLVTVLFRAGFFAVSSTGRDL